MKRIATITAAALIAGGTLAAPSAEARGRGGAVAAGVVGGLALGALAGSAAGAYGNGYGRPAYGDDRYGYRGAGYDAYERPRYRRNYNTDDYGY